jgi:flagella basal body P-ring formation protein FlgA
MICLRKPLWLLTLCLALLFPFPSGALSSQSRVSSVDKTSQIIPDATFREILIDFLCQRLGKESSDILISRLKLAGNRPVPPGKVTFQLYQKDRRTLEGFIRTFVIVSVDGVVLHKVKLNAWVDVFGQVVCASRNIKRGETIGKEDLYMERKNVSHLPPNVFTDADKAIGLMAKNNIKADTCLKEWMLKRSPTVVRGDLVTIIAESTGIKLTAPGRIMEKGYIGEMVRVQNAMSQKEIYAKVLNSSTVMVHF